MELTIHEQCFPTIRITAESCTYTCKCGWTATHADALLTSLLYDLHWGKDMKMNSYQATYAHGMLKSISVLIDGLRDYLKGFDVDPTIIKAVETISEATRGLGQVVEGVKDRG